MTEGAAWRPIRHMNLNMIGAQIRVRTPTVYGYLPITTPITVLDLRTDHDHTLGGWPVFGIVHILDTHGRTHTATDGDEYQEIS